MKKQGICSVCGCTDQEGCPEGCSWANDARTICSACIDLSEEEREEKRTDAFAELLVRAMDLKDRTDVLRSEMKPALKQPPKAKRRGKGKRLEAR